jgi:hypothetical protein
VISVLAIEVQPIGIMAPVYLIAFELSRMIRARRFCLAFDRVAKIGLGGVLGLAAYLILHPQILSLLSASPSPAEWGKQGSIYFISFTSISLRQGYTGMCLSLRDLLRTSWSTSGDGITCSGRSHSWLHSRRFSSDFSSLKGMFLYALPVLSLFSSRIRDGQRDVASLCGSCACAGPVRSAIHGGVSRGDKYARQDELQVARSTIAGRGTDLSHAHIFGDSIFWPVFKDLSFRWPPAIMYEPQRIPRGTIYLICGVDPPFFTLEHACANDLPAFGDMQLIEEFSWARRKYRIYERCE